MKKVTFVELTAFEGIIPLASAYLQMYACTDPDIAASFAFEICNAPVTAADAGALAEELSAAGSDVYAFSCYLWNMGIVERVLGRLLLDRPGAQFILGGPQVMNHAAHYVPGRSPNVVVCDGEGERTFQAYLRQVRADQPDFGAVPGLSFWRDGELIQTDKPERIRDLTEIPSPFTARLFEPGKYTFAIVESNRGCPYNCGFCFWGAATNAKVNRFETQRVMDDITWLSENGFATFFLADANWGMAPRDVDLTHHIVDCKKRTGYPLVVSMNAAKNKPDRVADITRILVAGGLLTSQPISLQSMDTGVLSMIDRSNIRPETYTALQHTLREEKISSYIEMIWPLPGETTDTFRDGLTKLCRSQADTILVYPQLLLRNTPIYHARERLGVRTRRVPDPVSEADVVVATNWVSEDQYDEGVWLYYAMQSLYNFRGLYYFANYLDRTGQLSFGHLFAAATDFYRATAGSAITDFFRESVQGLGNYYLLNAGMLAHLILHAQRAEFDGLLAQFVGSLPSWADPTARAAFELDLLARPYIYREQPTLPSYPFRQLRVEPQPGHTIEVSLPRPLAELLVELDVVGSGASELFRLRHPKRRKMPYHRERPLETNITYCQGMALHLREILPEWTPLTATSMAGL
jgi:hypothetical protein